MLTLELLICTIDRRIERVPAVLCPPQRGVRYLVSWQQSEGGATPPPAALTARDDVRIVTMPGKGLSANRNNALRHASADILLIADDDCRYPDGAFGRIIETFEKHPEAAVVTFQATDYEGRLMKPYATAPHLYKDRPRGSYVSSWEVAVRRAAPLPAFDLRFGLGAPRLCCGEEEIFVHEAHRRGLVVRYEPAVIVKTSAETTGKGFLTSAALQQSKGAVHCVMYGIMGAILRALKLLMTLPPHSHRFRVFRNYCRGVFYIVRTHHDHNKHRHTLS